MLNTNINAAGSSQDGKFSYNANYGHLDDTGFTPGNNLIRNNLSIGGRAQLTNNFNIQGTLNYSRTSFKSPPVAGSFGSGTTGAGSSVFGDVFYTPRSVDLMGLPFTNPITQGSVYYRQDNGIQNPNWTVANAGTEQLTNRTYGQLSTTYNFNENLNILFRFGLDVYNERNVSYQNKNGVDGGARQVSGVYSTWDNNNRIFEPSLILNGDYDLSEKLDMTFNLGQPPGVHTMTVRESPVADKCFWSAQAFQL